ncbi:MAG TPA: phosphate acyltransferase PlsX [Chromatiales bacterium]|nr:phosphate acyltransferase PlsX [Thiotrichales bacterium]HIP67501.1 phosphate acyltransferase PlsX [Chromatiales bacterium]
MSRYRIALDAMSGDHGPGVIVPAALKALHEFDDIELILVGDESQLTPLTGNNTRLCIQHASQVVDMDEAPAQALRGKKDSSMRVSINLVKSGEADACVSAGNTGALMATARFVLKTLPGIDRPAICTAVPSLHGHTHILDLGANIDSSAEQLYQFAVMGAALVEAVDGNRAPKIGLLNIGAEEMKGNQQVRDAAKLLNKSKLNYIGFVEGDDIYTSDVDVVVCDGLIGNVALKSTEGVAKMIAVNLKAEFMRNPLNKLMGLISKPVLSAFRKRIDPRRYNGASLLGLKGIAIKSHGSADELSFANAIKIARLEAQQNIPQRIDKLLKETFEN